MENKERILKGNKEGDTEGGSRRQTSKEEEEKVEEEEDKEREEEKKVIVVHIPYPLLPSPAASFPSLILEVYSCTFLSSVALCISPSLSLTALLFD